MAMEKATRRSCNYNRVIGATAQSCGETPMESIPATWARAQCRAIEIGVGGGFLFLAALEVMFGW